MAVVASIMAAIARTMKQYYAIWLLVLTLERSVAFTISIGRSSTSSCSSQPSRILFHGPLSSVPSILTSDQSTDGDRQGDNPPIGVENFVEMIRQAPAGTLQGEEAALLREIMASTKVDAADMETAELVDGLLSRLTEEWLARDQAADWAPTAREFTHAMYLWHAAAGDLGNRQNANVNVAAQRICQLYTDVERYQLSLAEQQAGDFVPMMQTLAACREKGMDRRVWDIVERLEQVHGIAPTPALYQPVIEALAKSRDRGAANRAETVLRQVAQRFPPGLDADDCPTGVTLESFNVVLTAWAKSGLDYGPERAEKLITYMDQLETLHGNPGVLKPNVQSFTSLIDAYTQKNDWERVAQAEGILNSVLDHYLSGEEDLEPNIASWTIVISAWARLSKKSYRNAPARAGRLLKRMEALYEEGRISFAPDAIAYITCMNALAASKTADGSQQAQDMLDEMHEKYLDGDDSMKPSARSIKVVIDSWVRNQDNSKSMERAEEMLDRYEDLLHSMGPPDDPPTVKDDVRDIYRSMIAGWSTRVDPEQCMAYLTDMIEKDLQPDCFCFDKVIETSTNAADDRALERTYKVMELLEDCQSKGLVKPNERIYTSFIRALTKARVDNLSQRAEEIVNKMNALHQAGEKGIAPTVFTYNALLLACSEETSPEAANRLEAFKLAIKTFNTIRNSKEGPDQVSFGNMLRCANLLPGGEQKQALVRSTFQLCCKRGLCNSFVIRDLQFAAPEPLWRSILDCPQGDFAMERLPSQWTRQFDKHQKQRSKY